MASVEYQNSILWRGEDPLKQKFAPRYDGTKKTTRYFPGQVPAWAREEKPEQDNEDMSKAKKRRRAAPVEDAAASRLKRLQASDTAGDSGAERLLRHRVIHDATILEAAEEEPPQVKKKKEEEEKKVKLQDVQAEIAAIRKNLPGYKEEMDIVKKEEEEEDDDDIAKSGPLAEVKTEVKAEEEEAEEQRSRLRERARELALLKRKKEEDDLKEELPEEDEEESEYETDSEDEDPRQKAMLKPVFVSRSQRDTVKEKEMLEKEEEEAEERRRLKLKERKVESKTMLIDEITKDEQAEREAQFNPDDASDIELIDDDDEQNEAEEYELWKIRELKRIKRDKEERVARQKELEWIEKRRNMTDEERMRDDERLDAKNPKKDETAQFNFLQKYYHKGTFFQDKATSGEEPLYNRDYHEPLEEEKFDKTLLPAAMQVRRGLFGKKGQVKHTHLTDVDTTDMSAAWAQHSKQVQRYQERMAGAKGVEKFDRPSSSKSSIL